MFCRQILWLGKSLRDEETDYPFAFHIGSKEDPPHWQREQLNQVLWKFLADHTGHNIDVRLECEMSEEMDGYQEIGGEECDGSISFNQYLRGWRGMWIGTPTDR